MQLRKFNDSVILAAFLVAEGAKKLDDHICKHLDGFQHDFHPLLDDLREQLPANILPEYPIPVNFIPRMTSGKVDKHTLATILEEVRLERHQIRDGGISEEIGSSQRATRQ